MAALLEKTGGLTHPLGLRLQEICFAVEPNFDPLPQIFSGKRWAVWFRGTRLNLFEKCNITSYSDANLLSASACPHLLPSSQHQSGEPISSLVSLHPALSSPSGCVGGLGADGIEGAKGVDSHPVPSR